MSSGSAPPLGQRPNEPAPGKDSLANPQGYDADGGRPTCPDCGLPFGEHPEYHSHGDRSRPTMELPGQRLEEDQLGGDPAEG